jgi:exonuclease VII small subunit
VLKGLNGIIEIEDKQLDAIDIINKESKDADVKFYLLSQRSPLNQDDIRKIARSLGLHTNGLTLEQIKTATYNFVKGNNKYADFDNIINKLNSKEDIIKSEVVELMENGSIELENDQYKIKETKEVLFDVYNEDKEDSLTALAKHLEEDKDKLDKVTKLVRRGRKAKE